MQGEAESCLMFGMGWDLGCDEKESDDVYIRQRWHTSPDSHSGVGYSIIPRLHR